MDAELARICRYPVKGLSPDSLDSVGLEPGAGLPHDRRFGLALRPAAGSAERSAWMPNTSFVALKRHARLARIETRYDDGAATLTVLRHGRQVTRGRLTDRVGRSVLEEFFSAFMGDTAGGTLRLVEIYAGGMFTDSPDRLISLINLETGRDLERIVGAPVDPIRFRGNLYFDGAPAWAELDWVGKEIAIGCARLEIVSRIDRCAATNVNPATAERDMNIPRTLQRTFGHTDLGVFGRVKAGGRVAVGDPFSLED